MGVPLAASSMLMREQHALSELSGNRSAHRRGSVSTGCWERVTSGSQGPGPVFPGSSGPAFVCARGPGPQVATATFENVTGESREWTVFTVPPGVRAAKCVPWGLPATQQCRGPSGRKRGPHELLRRGTHLWWGVYCPACATTVAAPNATCHHLLLAISLSFQKGTLRMNCLDCLDRTNTVQSFIALEVCPCCGPRATCVAPLPSVGQDEGVPGLTVSLWGGGTGVPDFRREGPWRLACL